MMIPRSDVSRARDSVFGHISGPRLYTVIGVNGHPFVLGTAKVLCTARSILDAVPAEVGHNLRDCHSHS
jgi:hypothetical protein